VNDQRPYRSPELRLGASCMLCGAPDTPGAICRECRVPIAGPDDERALTNASCPRCHVPLVAVALDVTSVVHVCEQCHGIFVPPRAWHLMLTMPERAEELEAKLPPRPPARGSLIDSVDCPVCARAMERQSFAAISSVVTDTCADRHGIWLDAGEIGAVIQFVKLRDQVGSDRLLQEMELSAMRERNEVNARINEQARIVRARLESAPQGPAAQRGIPPWQLMVIFLVLGAFTLLGSVARCTRRAERRDTDLTSTSAPGSGGAPSANAPRARPEFRNLK
jgi:Zn-finger nucleic acid-binding protein